MGRKKINISEIKNSRQKTVTFARRRSGLIKKAHELSVLCGVKVALVVFDTKNASHVYASTETPDALFKRYMEKCFITNESRKRKDNVGADDEDNGTYGFDSNGSFVKRKLAVVNEYKIMKGDSSSEGVQIKHNKQYHDPNAVCLQKKAIEPHPSGDKISWNANPAGFAPQQILPINNYTELRGEGYGSGSGNGTEALLGAKKKSASIAASSGDKIGENPTSSLYQNKVALGTQQYFVKPQYKYGYETDADVLLGCNAGGHNNNQELGVQGYAIPQQILKPTEMYNYENEFGVRNSSNTNNFGGEEISNGRRIAESNTIDVSGLNLANREYSNNDIFGGFIYKQQEQAHTPENAAMFGMLQENSIYQLGISNQIQGVDNGQMDGSGASMLPWGGRYIGSVNSKTNPLSVNENITLNPFGERIIGSALSSIGKSPEGKNKGSDGSKEKKASSKEKLGIGSKVAGGRGALKNRLVSNPSSRFLSNGNKTKGASSGNSGNRIHSLSTVESTLMSDAIKSAKTEIFNNNEKSKKRKLTQAMSAKQQVSDTRSTTEKQPLNYDEGGRPEIASANIDVGSNFQPQLANTFFMQTGNTEATGFGMWGVDYDSIALQNGVGISEKELLEANLQGAQFSDMGMLGLDKNLCAKTQIPNAMEYHMNMNNVASNDDDNHVNRALLESISSEEGSVLNTSTRKSDENTGSEKAGAVNDSMKIERRVSEQWFDNLKDRPSSLEGMNGLVVNFSNANDAKDGQSITPTRIKNTTSLDSGKEKMEATLIDVTFNRGAIGGELGGMFDIKYGVDSGTLNTDIGMPMQLQLEPGNQHGYANDPLILQNLEGNTGIVGEHGLGYNMDEVSYYNNYVIPGDITLGVVSNRGTENEPKMGKGFVGQYVNEEFFSV
ncbi:MADS-box transcription factor 1 [Zancudomyces culisetae]|uniref:MADS-box transcription factor 1 n=1 Tax=Zancudomyces culisetae TaxID=1213189 RepID=A0A1R1PTE1_ZANCU|nr:MADS-box transcription factor 1 [Zancudomyces culisetae]|eukprot:OMH84265.1 MADS-box transcription factor 1 [Zancudomyces culisetae]